MLLCSHYSAIAFVSDLRRRLPTDKDDSAASETLLRDVQKQNQLLDRYSDKPHHGMLLDEDLDTEATKLWNVCTRLGRENADKPARSSAGLKLILWSRVLAFHILHLCQWSTKCTVPVASHLMELALRMARLCIGPQAPVLCTSEKDIHSLADRLSAWQMVMTFRTRELFCRKPLTITDDYKISYGRWNRRMSINL